MKKIYLSIEPNDDISGWFRKKSILKKVTMKYLGINKVIITIDTSGEEMFFVISIY